MLPLTKIVEVTNALNVGIVTPKLKVVNKINIFLENPITLPVTLVPEMPKGVN